MPLTRQAKSMDERIVVAIDNRQRAAGPLRTARWLSERTGVQVEVLAVYQHSDLYTYGYQDPLDVNPPQATSVRIEALRSKAQSELAAVGGGAADWPLTVQIGRVVAPAIARFAEAKKAVLILMGIRQPEPLERWLGRQELLRVVHLSHIPVLAVPRDIDALSRQVIIAIDFSAFSRRAAHQVVRWLAPGASVHLVHTAPTVLAGEAEFENMFSMDAYRAWATRRLDELAAELRKAADVGVQFHVNAGDPARMIVGLADEIGADLIAMGSHGAGFFGRLVMGSVSGKLMHAARCSLFIAPPQRPAQELLEMDPQGVLKEITDAEEDWGSDAPGTES